jgi:isoleucyl-tRNA synthetase
MALARRLTSLGRAARAQANIKVRQPLRRALIALPPDTPALLADIVAEELNVDEVLVADNIGDILTFELAPNFRLLGPRLGERAKQVRQALNNLDPADAVGRLERGETIAVALPEGDADISGDEVQIRVRGRQGFAVSRQAAEAVALDLEIDDELRRRGLLRDVVRQVQEMRRSAGLDVADRIQLNLDGVDELQPWAIDIAREVLAETVSFKTDEDLGSPLKTDDNRIATARITPVT